MAYYGGSSTSRWSALDVRQVSTVLFLIFAIGISGYLGYDALSKTPMFKAGLFKSSNVNTAERAKTAETGPSIRADFVVAARQIPAGTKLYPSMFKTETRTTTNPEALFTDVNAVEGKFATQDITTGTLVGASMLSSQRTANVVTAKIPPGQRAVSIAVDAVTGVEGWARPGAKVDVVWATEHRRNRLVTTIVEGAEVLSAERSTEAPTLDNKRMFRGQELAGPVPTHVTLLVSVKDAQKIQLAKNSGTLNLTLRGDADDANEGSGTITLDNLLNPIVQRPEKDDGRVVIGGKEFALRGGRLVDPVKDKDISGDEGRAGK